MKWGRGQEGKPKLGSSFLAHVYARADCMETENWKADRSEKREEKNKTDGGEA